MDERKFNMIRSVLMLPVFALLIVVPLAGQSKKPSADVRKAMITFVELGSVKCIPCRQMQPVMKAIEQKYGAQVKVIFHDVWTEEGRPMAVRYNIRLIPTQVFLDSKGKEFFRHEGFFPEDEIHKLLQKRGIKRLDSAS